MNLPVYAFLRLIHKTSRNTVKRKTEEERNQLTWIINDLKRNGDKRDRGDG